MLVGDILRILDVVGAQNVEVTSRNVQLSCLLAPWTHAKKEDHSPSMGIKIDSIDRSLVHCFACSFGGTMTMLLEQLELHSGVDYGELAMEIEELDTPDPARLLALVGEYEDRADVELEDTTVPEVYLEQFEGNGHLEYMYGRGFNEVTLREWGVRCDRGRGRVVFPVRMRDGRLVGATGRGITDDVQPRWWNYWNFTKGRHLFGIHLLPPLEQAHIVVVEGKCDAMRVWQEADEEYLPVSLMGSKASLRQQQLIIEHAHTVTLFLDNDKAGKEGTQFLEDVLSDVVPLFRARYPDARKDPDALGPDVVTAIQKSIIV